MIALLSYSTSWCQSKINTNSSTGGLTDTTRVYITYDALRKANAKMVELKYQKEINDSLQSIIANDEYIIKVYDNNIKVLNNQLKEAKKKRNVAITGAVFTAVIGAVLFILK